MTLAELQSAYDKIHHDATRLAGGLMDLSQRAAVYHHVFRDSGGNHVFPLIAAHGALWARGWFRFGLKLGRVLVWQYFHDSKLRQRQLAKLDDFANAFRDINRRVCIDIYTNYHFTRQFGDCPAVDQIVPLPQLNALQRLHAASRSGRRMSDAERREIFLAHFLQEQEFVVGPAIETALAAFDWPLVRAIALRPIIRFAYLRQPLFFRNFARREDRIEKGLIAFDKGAEVGWQNVESALRKYAVLPERFFVEPVSYFADLRDSILTA